MGAPAQKRLDGMPSLPFSLVAHRAYRACAVAIDLPSLMLVLQGTKRLRWNERTLTCPAGSYVMVHRPERIDMDGIPAAGGPYRALVIAFPWRVVDLARRLLAGEMTPVPAGRVEAWVTTGAIDALRRDVEGLLDVALGCAPPSPVLDHRLLGLLVALAGAGQDQFLRTGDPSLSSRVRTLVSADPAFSWESHHLEEKLLVSGATLRRKLAEERTGLRALLREARLHHGLMLLQTSRRPVKAVAAECGYRSVATFRRNFVARFGVAAAHLAKG
jgi:AraC-like DNA-binding protein